MEEATIRWISANRDVADDGVSWTPLHDLEGIITPSGLHFERHQNGVPQIDGEAHRLSVHGLVRQPLSFTIEALKRYPQRSRIGFVECGGNSNFELERRAAADPRRLPARPCLQQRVDRRAAGDGP